MEKRFKVLRFIGTAWRILAWIVLIVGLLLSVGVLLLSIFGGGLMGRFGLNEQQLAWSPWAFGVVGGIAGFIVSLVGTIVCFLMVYAVGEFVYLLINIEENTRLAAQSMDFSPTVQTYPIVQAYSEPPPPPPPEPPQAPPHVDSATLKL